MQGGDGRVVDVAEEEVVNGAIPVAGKLVPGDAVPPVGIEAAVGEESEFGEEVELLKIWVSVIIERTAFLGVRVGGETYDTFPDYIPGEEVLHHEREEHVT